MTRELELKETITLFVHTTIGQIIREEETPRVNFVFPEAAYKDFEDTINNTFQIEGEWITNIDKRNIEQLRNMYDMKYPTIYIKDHNTFFTHLTDISNSLIRQYSKYGEQTIPRQLLLQVMRRIWLRMGPADFYNVENFLLRQKEFINNELLDDYIFGISITNFYEQEVLAENIASRCWDEAPNCMKFKIIKDKKYHSLPHIFYGITDDTCYIYAIQNDRERKRIPEIEKKLYKEFRGKGQPSMVYTMKLFIDMLKEKGINTIKIPKLQVLSYRYHQLLSEKTKYDFEKKWTPERVAQIDELTGWRLETRLKEYERDKLWYNNVVDKEDLIHTLKTTNFINLIERIVDEDDTLTFIDENKVQDELTICVNQKVKRLTTI